MVQKQDIPLCPVCKESPRFLHPETYNLWGYCKPCTYSYNRKRYREDESTREYYKAYSKARYITKPRVNFNWRGTRLSRVYNTYGGNAKKKGLEWDIPKTIFMLMTERPCYYCGTEPQQRGSHNGHRLTYNGLDRVDNCKGYVIENVVPCCKKCNWMKKTYSLDEFIDHCKAIVEYRSRFSVG